MDTHDLFFKLTAGAKFNKERFKNDLKVFQKGKKLNTQRLIETITSNNKTELHESGESNMIECKKRKHDHSNESKSEMLTLLDNITVPTDGSKIKNKKIKLNTEDKKLKLEQEQINHFKNLHRISTTGGHVPKPISTFDELTSKYQLMQIVVNNVKNCGYILPTPIQMQAIPAMLEERQILACAPTGSGKTAAFLIPIIHHLKTPQKKGFRAVILCPTRELAKQTCKECSLLSEGIDFKVHVISKINQALTKYGPNSSQKFDILITTPKRLLFLLKQDPPAISLSNVEWLVIDEADKLFENGTYGFKDQLVEISKACTNENLHCAMFSATNTPAVTKWCRQNMKGLITITIGHRNAATDLVDQQLLFVGEERGKLLALRDIIRKGVLPPVLIFVQSKERAQELFNELIYDDINVDVIHADRTQTQRDNIVRCFREGKIWVLICTDLMSRGIDFKGVNLVINFDFPTSAISYIHRIGRTGRAGHKGKAITFFTLEDTTNLRSIASIIRDCGCDVPDYMLKMKKHNKKEKRELEHRAPLRHPISTIPYCRRQWLLRNREKLSKAKEAKKHKTNGKTSSTKLKKAKNKDSTQQENVK